MTFNQILDKYRKISFSERDKGDRFERLVQAYLKTDPKYAYFFKKVWLWEEFPCKSDLGGCDTGIDLVALTYDGDYWAIQCKCYQQSAVIDKPAVDSFLATSSRTFLNEEYKTTPFSHRLWVSTTNNWGSNATEAIKNQDPPVTRINLYDLMDAPVDWEKLEQGMTGELSRTPQKSLLPHQKESLEKSHEYYKTLDRGKLIMACGTGKTFNSLRIAEHETGGKGLILFLVPSISLLGQTLNAWTADAKEPINAICICSDSEISRKKTKGEDTDAFSVVDLALPASTDVKNILGQFQRIKRTAKGGMTVVFSTYQSIDVISKAQNELAKEHPELAAFDLIICDEAHRTTGVTIAGTDESAFVKVHSNDFLKAKKRLYMTATPRLFNDDSKSRAAQAEAVLCSMDDPKLYGEEIYRIGFGEAVERGLLTDYKVLILTLNEGDVPEAVQKIITNPESEINTDDASKLIGCINALSKKILGDEGSLKETDPEPMRRAVAFCQNIAISQMITGSFNQTAEAYIGSLPEEEQSKMTKVASRHIDGTMSAPKRDELLGWLKEKPEDENECRVLTNVRCLSEGVDVPTLDAVLFLSARNSQVDVVQSVGRVMRKAPGKKYGYIIIPVVVPASVEADKALDDNERYKVVWTVLNALRAHDDRFNATVNKIELNKKRPGQILVGRPEYTFQDGEPILATPQGNQGEINRQLALQFEQLQSVVFARLVQKVGDRRYWEQWAKDVAQIAERYIERITRIVKEDGTHRKAFFAFLNGLQKNINPSITATEAIEMLSQHIITKPVFEALFEGYSFVKNNPISVSMQTMLDLIEAQSMEKETEVLQKFYESVRSRAADIDNAEGKQRIIIELYDKFFKTAFPKMVERLGIVYTPVEVVDFIIHSVNDILKKEFDRSLSDENVHILDPFTGTGTFISRLIQSGLIEKDDLLRKYQQEIHANEIVLLAYYIAAVNIENTFHDAVGDIEYTPFEGICLTDTFQLGESDESEKLFSEMFPQNSERVQRQKKAPLRVIMGNPPYSVGQKSANDNAQNQSYTKLDTRISKTYAAQTDANNKNSLYDSYIKAFRWSSDRLDTKHGGIIAFISNGSWIDGNAQDGFRKCFEKEFTSIYVINLRGNCRTQGELRRKEGGNVFGIGSRTPISITILVKKPNNISSAKIHYYDIGDYLSREEKLSIIRKFNTIINPDLALRRLSPNEQGDWISHRNSMFETFIPIVSENQSIHSYFVTNTPGLQSNRDPWVYNFNKNNLLDNISRMIAYYNELINQFEDSKKGNSYKTKEDYIENDESKIKWTSSLISHFERLNKAQYEPNKVNISLYRPFNKLMLYYGDKMIHRKGKSEEMFPNVDIRNFVICLSGIGDSKSFSILITDCIPNVQLLFNGQCFPQYYYENQQKKNYTLFDKIIENHEFVRRDGISDLILDRAQKQYGKNVTKEDIFYYVYGFLHSPEYREMFTNDLKKMLPRMPLVQDVRVFWAFSKAGRKLADLHLNYESVPAFEGLEITGAEPLSFLDAEPKDTKLFLVEKMRFPKKGQKDTIIYNSRITIENIPDKAYQYVVNGKSAIEWIMERYQVTTHKESGIKNNPNDWAREVGNSRYILDLLLSIINVSVQTVDIVESLPKLEFE